MIKFALVCDSAHDFESWFPDGDAYEIQVKRGQVSCPLCNSTKIGKAIMAPALVARRSAPMPFPPHFPGRPSPSVSGSDVSKPGQADTHDPKSGNSKSGDSKSDDPKSDGPKPMALLDERHMALRAMMQHVHAKIMENTDDVGKRFPTEARRMHEGEIPTRSIRGEASLEDARELLEDGVQILPVPVLPEERN